MEGVLSVSMLYLSVHFWSWETILLNKDHYEQSDQHVI